MASNKNILFYSPQCAFCKEVIGAIVQRGLRDHFVLIDAMQNMNKLPQFVDRVPFIVTPLRQHFTDQMIRTFIEHLTSVYGGGSGRSGSGHGAGRNMQQQQPPQQQPPMAPARSGPMHPSQMPQGPLPQGPADADEPEAFSFGSFQTNSVSYNDYETTADDSHAKGFSWFGANDSVSIGGGGVQGGRFPEPEEVNRGDRIPDTAYQRFLAQRDADINAIRSSMPPTR